MSDNVVVAPFGASRAGVTALVPEATLYDTTVPAGRRGVTEQQVDAWLVALSARVARRLDGWERLSTELDEGEPMSDRQQLAASAADLVHNGAASYLEAARHPEQAGKSSSSYADLLWRRFTEGLDELAAWLELRLRAGDPNSTAPGVDAPGLAFAFPCPSFTNSLRF